MYFAVLWDTLDDRSHRCDFPSRAKAMRRYLELARDPAVSFATVLHSKPGGAFTVARFDIAEIKANPKALP